MTDKPTSIEEIILLLRQIHSKEVTLECRMDLSPQIIYCGDVEYHVSNGWRIRIFNDCGDWDFIDSVFSPDGRIWQYNDIYKHDDEGRSTKETRRLYDEEPRGDREMIWQFYGLPGYLQHRSKEWDGWKPAISP